MRPGKQQTAISNFLLLRREQMSSEGRSGVGAYRCQFLSEAGVGDIWPITARS